MNAKELFQLPMVRCTVKKEHCKEAYRDGDKTICNMNGVETIMMLEYPPVPPVPRKARIPKPRTIDWIRGK